MKGLPLDLLSTFAVIAERGAITAAARTLGLSKATVSKHLTELEHRLGVALFARTTRALTLTQAGSATLERVRRIMAEAEALLEDASATRSSPSGLLKIAAPMVFARLWLGPALPDFMTANPGIVMEFSLDDRTVDLVSSGFDAAVRIGPMPDSSLMARRIAPVRLHVVASPTYWARHGKPASPDDLRAHTCFRYLNADGGVWRFTGPEGTEHRVKVDGPLASHGGEIEMAWLCAGLGAAILPDFIVCEQIRAGRLERVLEAWTATPLTLHLLTPPGRAKPRRLEVFQEFLLERFGGRTPPWGVG